LVSAPEYSIFSWYREPTLKDITVPCFQMVKLDTATNSIPSTKNEREKGRKEGIEE
jgi:hypothetical protein